MELTCIAIDGATDGTEFRNSCQDVVIYVSIISEDELGLQLDLQDVSITYSRRRKSYLVNLPTLPAQAIIERGDFNFTTDDESITFRFRPSALANNV